jgi:hypothetical protein
VFSGQLDEQLVMPVGLIEEKLRQCVLSNLVLVANDPRAVQVFSVQQALAKKDLIPLGRTPVTKVKGARARAVDLKIVGAIAVAAGARVERSYDQLGDPTSADIVTFNQRHQQLYRKDPTVQYDVATRTVAMELEKNGNMERCTFIVTNCGNKQQAKNAIAKLVMQETAGLTRSAVIDLTYVETKTDPVRLTSADHALQEMTQRYNTMCAEFAPIKRVLAEVQRDAEYFKAENIKQKAAAAEAGVLKVQLDSALMRIADLEKKLAAAEAVAKEKKVKVDVALAQIQPAILQEAIRKMLI